jgi:hypothetical protein
MNKDKHAHTQTYTYTPHECAWTDSEMGMDRNTHVILSVV